jgi:hypothetical protein
MHTIIRADSFTVLYEEVKFYLTEDCAKRPTIEEHPSMLTVMGSSRTRN